MGMAQQFRKSTAKFADDRLVNALVEAHATAAGQKYKLGKSRLDMSFSSTKGDNLLGSKSTTNQKVAKIGKIDFSKHNHCHGAIEARSLQPSPRKQFVNKPVHLESRELVVPLAEKLSSMKVVEALLSRY